MPNWQFPWKEKHCSIHTRFTVRRINSVIFLAVTRLLFSEWNKPRLIWLAYVSGFVSCLRQVWWLWGERWDGDIELHTWITGWIAWQLLITLPRDCHIISQFFLGIFIWSFLCRNNTTLWHLHLTWLSSFLHKHHHKFRFMATKSALNFKLHEVTKSSSSLRISQYQN